MVVFLKSSNQPYKTIMTTTPNIENEDMRTLSMTCGIVEDHEYNAGDGHAVHIASFFCELYGLPETDELEYEFHARCKVLRVVGTADTKAAWERQGGEYESKPRQIRHNYWLSQIPDVPHYIGIITVAKRVCDLESKNSYYIVIDAIDNKGEVIESQFTIHSASAADITFQVEDAYGTHDKHVEFINEFFGEEVATVASIRQRASKPAPSLSTDAMAALDKVQTVDSAPAPMEVVRDNLKAARPKKKVSKAVEKAVDFLESRGQETSVQRKPNLKASHKYDVRTMQEINTALMRAGFDICVRYNDTDRCFQVCTVAPVAVQNTHSMRNVG